MKVFNLGEMLSSSATSVFKSLHIGSTVRVTTDHYDPANGIVGSIQRNSKGNINMIICTNIDTSESNIMGIKPIKLNNGDFTISSAIKRVHDNVIDNNRLFITHIRQFDLLTLNSDHTYKILDVSPLANDKCIVNHKRIDNLVDFMLKSDYQLNQARSYTEIERDNDKIASGDVFRHKDKDLILLNIGSDVNASVRFLKESYVFDTDEIVRTIESSLPYTDNVTVTKKFPRTIKSQVIID